MPQPQHQSPPSPELHSYLTSGWCRFPVDPTLLDWIEATGPAIRTSIADPENANWWRHGDTWFAGVNVLPNDADGAVPDGMPLGGVACDFIRKVLGYPDLPWDRAQVSVCHPGYPKPMAGESPAVYRFRRDRDAAHIDGLAKEGPDRRRFLREYHGFVLGIPVTRYSGGAAPLSLWEGSHNIVRTWLCKTFHDIPPDEWGTVDLTDSYQSLRREIFETCRRITICAAPGESYILHRHMLHGMAPWQDGATAEPEGRVIVYFRPPVPDQLAWLGHTRTDICDGTPPL